MIKINYFSLNPGLTHLIDSSDAQLLAQVSSTEAKAIDAGAEEKTKGTTVERRDERVEEAKEKESENGKPSDSDDDSDSTETSWNAVCVIGLRVYSMNANTTINIITPKDIEGVSL